MKWEKVEVKFEEGNIIMVYDDEVDSGWGTLRCLPIFYYLSIENFTFPTKWRKARSRKYCDYLDYRYHVLGDIPQDIPSLGIITSQHFEDNTPHTVKNIINRYTQRDNTLIVSTESKEYTPRGGQRPLEQEQFVDECWSYSDLYEAFKDIYKKSGYSLPLYNTKNLFFQDNALIYKHISGKEIKSVIEIFDVIEKAKYLPLHDVLSKIFSYQNEVGSNSFNSENEMEIFSRWLRRRIEINRNKAGSIAKKLNKKAIMDEEFFDKTFKSESNKQKIISYMEDLNYNENIIDFRYYNCISNKLSSYGDSG